MGAATFENLGIGVDAKEVFKRLHEEVGYESGHGGYSGTLVEKGSFVIITHTPLPQREAEALAQRLIDEGDQRIDDKWGPAGAIPVVLDTREVEVGPFDYTPNANGHSTWPTRTDPNLLEAVKPLVKLKAGEEIEGVNTYVYETPERLNHSYRTNSPARRSNCRAKVTIKKPPLTREAEFEVTLPSFTTKNRAGQAYVDYQAAQKALVEAASSNVRLKQGERIVDVRQIGHKAGKSKVTAEATKGKAITRYVVKGSAQHATWETGFDSQALARAWATDTAKASEVGCLLEIEAVTRREGNQPLVVVGRDVIEHVYKATAIISRDAKATRPEGWLFFGWASS
jgi:hypothetical protein